MIYPTPHHPGSIARIEKHTQWRVQVLVVSGIPLDINKIT